VQAVSVIGQQGVCVFQDWLFDLTMQQQSVLVLGCRGPDGIAKFHPTKLIVARYRATVLKAAYLGRPMRVDEGDDTTFMTLIGLSDDAEWMAICKQFFDHVDEVPHHYYMHLMHGAEIAGYKHPHELFRRRWNGFYLRSCHDLHLNPETEPEMDRRQREASEKAWGKYQIELREVAEREGERQFQQDGIDWLEGRDTDGARRMAAIIEQKKKAVAASRIVAPLTPTKLPRAVRKAEMSEFDRKRARSRMRLRTSAPGRPSSKCGPGRFPSLSTKARSGPRSCRPQRTS
jgi:hypothetical protein